MRTHYIAIYAIFAAAALAASCNKDIASDGSERESMFQVATLQSLMVGNYDGFVSVGQLRQKGDIGLGTFDRVDGEMIVLDGTVYQARHDGSVQVADDNTGVPFSTVTCFDDDIDVTIAPSDSFKELTRQLDAAVEANGKNFIYAVRIDIKDCKSMHVRSVVPQAKPYRPLAEALVTDQREFTYEHIGGTVVGVYFPAFFNMQNAVGWHLHFISDDRSKGGHILGLKTSEPVTAILDATPYFNMYMPESADFSKRDLDDDMSEDIGKVEQ